MKLIILVLLLLFSVGFFTLAYFQQEARRGGYAMLSGFVIVLLSGLLVAAFGLEYRDGSTITESVDGDIIVTYDYIDTTVTEQFIVGFPLMLAGFWGALVVIGALRDTRYDSDE